MADIKLNFVNASNDANNSQVIIFQQDEALPGDIVSAWRMLPVGNGNEKTIEVPDDSVFFIAIADRSAINDGTLNTGALSIPPALMLPGQTANITGDLDTGYTITIAN